MTKIAKFVLVRAQAIYLVPIRCPFHMLIVLAVVTVSSNNRGDKETS